MSADLVIRSLSPAITIFSIPFSRFGLIPFGGRSTAIKLRNDEVFVVVSSPCDEPTTNAINAMGTVKYLITPDYEHAMNISAFHKRYPDAKVIGPGGIDQKKPDVKWTGIMGQGGEDVTYGFEDEIKLHYFPGHANKEIAILHVPSRTLIEADLVFNLPPKEQYSTTKQSPAAVWPLSVFQNGLRPDGASHQSLSGMVGKDKAAMKRDVAAVSAWDFDRIIPCHGDVIETGGKEAWKKVMKKYL